MLRIVRAYLCLGLLAGFVFPVHAQTVQSLHLVGRIDLTNIEGRIDHFSADVKGGRLFMSALGNNTVEVIDVPGGTLIKTIRGLAEPQGVLFEGGANRVVVACGDDGSVRFFEGSSYQPIGIAKPGDDSDNVRFDARARHIIIGYSDGLAIFDGNAKEITKIPLDGHAESFQLEKHGTRAFVNVPTKQEIEVVDLLKNSVIARWPFKKERQNFPMSLDEEHHRLFVGFRNPAKLLVLDTGDGRTVASLDIVGDTDDVFYDAAKHRIYVIGGEGLADVIEQKDSDHYGQIDGIKTARGARTGYFVPEWNRLFIAVPHRGAQRAEVLVFSTE